VFLLDVDKLAIVVAGTQIAVADGYLDDN